MAKLISAQHASPGPSILKTILPPQQHIHHKESIVGPLEKMKRKFRALCRFRALVRRVMANKYWLMEVDDDVYEGDDVKKRVVHALRTKSKKTKALLSLKDKALLNKPAHERTDTEKHYIYRKIGGLKCFKRYPNHVKKKLAAATYFVYYGPNRVVVKQNHDAHALYFIVTGEVVVSVMVFDELLNQYNSVNVFVMNPGDMFGEVSLLHNIKRTATCTTTAHCEFLALMKEDFKNVLQASLQQQWQEVYKAMNSFSYFDTFDEVARREGCITAKMKFYEPNETILGDGAGMPNFVYFVLSGTCQMIETLKIITTRKGKKNFYHLYDPFILKVDSELDLEKKYFSGVEKSQGSGEVDVTAELSKEKDPSGSTVNQTIDDTKSDVKWSSFTSDGRKYSDTSRAKRSSMKSTLRDMNTAKRSSFKEDVGVLQEDVSDVYEDIPTEVETHRKLSRLSKVQESADGLKVIKDTESVIGRTESTRFSTQICYSTDERPNLRTYFMQVCIFRPGSTFGMGENMKDRRIVALTKVDCMLLPKIWLLQRNTANIWSRIQHYLEKKIPTKKQLFKEFVTQRQWLESREAIVGDIVRRSKTINYTTIHDVPYSIRMEEMID